MAGAGYKLFNTGDVLTAAQVNTYLMEQTVMVFADAAARTTALTGVVSEGMISYLKDTNAVEVYNGSAWVASDDPNAIQNTIVDAKGDLITATAADTPARLAVGSNGDTLVADSAASTGLRWQSAKVTNGVINGGFDIWQRGTSFTSATVYTADRWMKGGASASTVSRQSSGLTGFNYCARVQRNSGSSSTSYIDFATAMETEESLRFAGQTVVLSFWARAGSNYSSASSAFRVRLIGGTGTDQTVFSGYTGSADQIDQTLTITTSWVRYSVTGTVSSSITELTPYFGFQPVGTASTNDYFEITGVQLERGSVPTAFNRSGGTLQGELAACQRYYFRFGGQSPFNTYGMGIATSSTNLSVNIQHPVPLRVNATSVDFANLGVYNSGSVLSATNAILDRGGIFITSLNITSSGMTTNNTYALLANNSTASHFGLSAEL
jgi:hypothetical protein